MTDEQAQFYHDAPAAADLTMSSEDMLARLRAAEARIADLEALAGELRDALERIAANDWGLDGGRCVMGNEQLPGNAGAFYRAYNAGIRSQFEKTQRLAKSMLARPDVAALPEVQR